MSEDPKCPARWEQDRSLVLWRLDDHDLDIKRIREEQIQTRIFVGIHKANASIWGAVAGAVVSAVVSVIIAVASAYFRKGP